ncbi:MAG: hypothetical protein OXI70_04525 [Chloroflexota bacterium]|nr:hypothetical protein [Chloroflexota bacterium]
MELAGKGTTALRRGDVFEHRTAGGGGWGPPERREAAARVRDRRAGKVTG